MLQCGHVVFARFDGLSAAWALPDDDPLRHHHHIFTYWSTVCAGWGSYSMGPSNPIESDALTSETLTRTRLGGLNDVWGTIPAPDICFAPNTNGPECGAVEPWS